MFQFVLHNSIVILATKYFNLVEKKSQLFLKNSSKPIDKGLIVGYTIDISTKEAFKKCKKIKRLP